MRKRICIHRKAVQTQNPHYWEKYRDLRNKVIAEIMASRTKLKQSLTRKVFFYPQQYDFRMNSHMISGVFQRSHHSHMT